MSAWTTAVTDLRNYISDGPTDKLAWRKQVVGDANGTDLVFKTYEYRRITDFTTAAAPLGVYLNGTLIDNVTGIAADDLATGTFTLTAAPSNTDRLEAAYYYQFFLDPELVIFLTQASQWIGVSGSDYTMVSELLRPAALDFGAAKAYQKAATLLATQFANVYSITNIPSDESYKIIDSYIKASESYMKSAEAARSGVYTRQDQAKAPLFVNIGGVVRDVPPNR